MVNTVKSNDKYPSNVLSLLIVYKNTEQEQLLFTERMKEMKQLIQTVLTSTKKDVLTQSAAKAFKPIIDIIDAILKGAKPFVIVLTALAIIIQLLKTFNNFNQGRNIQKNIYSIVGIIFSATLILTYQSWLIPILKKVAGL